MCAAVLIGSVTWEMDWKCCSHSVPALTPPVSGQPTPLQCCQPSRQRQRLSWRHGCWISFAFQWRIWKTSQTVHLPWHNVLYLREGGFQERHWKQAHLFTQEWWHFSRLSGISACLAAFCPRHCSCWWMWADRKCPLGTQTPLEETPTGQLAHPQEAL